MIEQPEVLDRAHGVSGGELVLRRVGPAYEIISNGVFLMDTRDGRSERALVQRALDELPAHQRGVRVLIAGLGAGFSVRAALDDPRVSRVLVVEWEPRIIGWHSGPLAAVTDRALDDSRCRVECANIVDWIGAAVRSGDEYDVLCMDVDNGPEWTVVDGNQRLYEAEAMDQLLRIMAPTGVVSFWSAAPTPRFETTLRSRFGTVRREETEVARGEPDVVYIARR
ncbi:spermidine synthase family protein [Spiractinospora alimapuensis]|uniref:spermidine synthase n=1 Tax=Spiractinospora alimapuensis TaxID=2820884 RepID=UPI001F1C6D63|nr:spermidine synthase [Spiractinospora alimapuensis]